MSLFPLSWNWSTVRDDDRSTEALKYCEQLLLLTRGFKRAKMDTFRR